MCILYDSWIWGCVQLEYLVIQHFNVIFWPWLSTQVCQNWILDIIFTNEIWSFIWLFPQRTDCQFFWWHRAMVWIFYCGSIGKIGWWILWSISITIYNSLEFSRSYNKIDSKKLQVHSRDIDREKWILRYFSEVECLKSCVGRQLFVNTFTLMKN